MRGHRRRCRALLAYVAATAATLTGRTAPAQHAPAASPEASAGDALVVRELLREGFELRRLGRDDEALARFARAHALAPSGLTLAQQGLAEQALGRWIASQSHLVAALSTRDDAWIARHSTELRGALDEVRAHLASLRVVGGPAGARVRLDGVDVGALPLEQPVFVTAGEVRLEVSADGYASVVRTVLVRPRLDLREEVTLAPAVSHEDEPPRARAPRAAPTPRDSTAPAPSPFAHPAPWILGASGLALGVTSAVLFSLRGALERRLVDEAQCTLAAQTNEYLCPATHEVSARALYADAARLDVVADGALALGIASISVGALWLTLRAARVDRRVTTAPSAGRGAVLVRF